MTTPKPKRRWFRFSLRTLLVFVVLLSVSLGWFAWMWESAREQPRAIVEIEAAGGWVSVDVHPYYQNETVYSWVRRNFVANSVVSVDLGGKSVSDVSLLSGLEGLTELSLGTTKVHDISPLAELEALEHLDLSATPVTDVSPLAGLERLEFLRLDRTPVIDISPLAGLEALERLDLSSTPVTDVSPLAGLERLEFLDISTPPVTDLSPLTSLRRLKQLNLFGTQKEDVDKLQQSLPHCAIVCMPPGSEPQLTPVKTTCPVGQVAHFCSPILSNLAQLGKVLCNENRERYFRKCKNCLKFW